MASDRRGRVVVGAAAPAAVCRWGCARAVLVSWVGLYTRLLLPIWYVEWQNRGHVGGTIDCAIWTATYNWGKAIKEVLNAKNCID